MLELILGGARSGKSGYAEQRAVALNKEVIYIATARALDPEMEQRIERHRKRRANVWQTVEEPIALADTLRRYATPERCILVDCLTLWLSNILFARDGSVQEAIFEQERQALIHVIRDLPGYLLMVSNEVGMGVVPVHQSARRFVDEAGWLHQELGQVCDRVVFIISGIPQVLKGASV